MHLRIDLLRVGFYAAATSLILSVPITSAQPRNVFFERYSGAEGLHSKVRAILQDRQGFMWFGSAGITKYDGYRFVKYTSDPDDPGSLRGIVSEIYEDQEGLLWIATNEGLFRFDPTRDTFRHYRNDKTAPGSLSDNFVKDVIEDRHGTMWALTSEGVLNRLDRSTERFTRYPLNPEHVISLYYISRERVYEDRQGRLWIGAWGLHRFDPEAEAFEHYLPDPARRTFADEAAGTSNAVSAILDDGGGLWIGTVGGGLHRFDPATGRYTHSYMHDPNDPASLSGNSITSLHEDGQGGLWIGTESGLNYFDRLTETFTVYRNDPANSNSLSSDRIRCVYEDRMGGLWIGTYGGGVNYFDRSRKPFRLYQHDPANPASSLSHNHLFGIYEDHEGVLWLATGADGLNRFDRSTGARTVYRHDPEDPRSIGGTPFNVVEDRDGVLWIGTGGGLDSFDRATETFAHHTAVERVNIYYLLEDQEGVLWLAAGDAVYRFDRTTGTVLARYRHDPNDATTISDNGAASIFEDHDGTIWVASGEGAIGGLNRYNRDTDTFTRFLHDPQHSNSLSSRSTHQIHERRQEPGVLWITTFGGGLNRFDTSTGQFTWFTEKNSDLPSNLLYASLEDEQGRLWISTYNGGLSRFTPETGEFKNYGVDDGLQGMEFEVQSFHRSVTGEMFFGGQNGLNAFFPGDIEDNVHPPLVVLTDFKLFNESVPVGEADSPLKQHISAAEAVTLRHDENDISFDYVGLHYSDPERNHYAYMLHPYDEDWRDVGTQRGATYTSLPPGEYSFRVKAANSDGVWNEEGASIRITIRPPWWSTRWAYLLYILFALAGILAAHRLQRSRLIRRERERAMQREVEQARQIDAMNRQLRHHERQLEGQNRKLLEIDQLKSRFFANISHELRTPLTLILGPLDDALAGIDAPDLLVRQAPLMRRNARRLLRLISQLLDLSRLEAGGLHLEVQPTDLNRFVRQIVLAFSSRANRAGITLLYDGLGEDELHELVDRDKLEKVISNLLSNALKFTPRGGKVRVALHVLPYDPPSAEDGSTGSAQILVEDTGRGIHPDVLPKIFDRFYQVDSSPTRAQEGSGIGLALTKELVELHKGTISVESTVGFGTRFTVLLPLRPAETDRVVTDGAIWLSEDAELEVEAGEESADVLPDAGTATTPAAAPRACVLIVEDNHDMQVYLGELLRKEGYNVEVACDGHDGLARARTLTPDLVISDIMMPRMDGFALCREIKASEQLSHVPVVLLTARAGEEDKLEGIEAGADDYLSKPFSAEELLLRTENLIEIRRLLRARFSNEVRVGPSEIVVPSSEARFVEKVRAIVEAELSNSRLTMEQLADGVGLSLRQLHRRLKAAVGLTPAGYVRMMRLQRAAQLLQQKAGNVSEVAYSVGFNDVDYFSRLFRQTHGVPPSQYGAALTD